MMMKTSRALVASVNDVANTEKVLSEPYSRRKCRIVHPVKSYNYPTEKSQNKFINGIRNNETMNAIAHIHTHLLLFVILYISVDGEKNAILISFIATFTMNFYSIQVVARQ